MRPSAVNAASRAPPLVGISGRERMLLSAAADRDTLRRLMQQLQQRAVAGMPEAINLR